MKAIVEHHVTRPKFLTLFIVHSTHNIFFSVKSSAVFQIHLYNMLLFSPTRKNLKDVKALEIIKLTIFFLLVHGLLISREDQAQQPMNRRKRMMPVHLLSNPHTYLHEPKCFDI